MDINEIYNVLFRDFPDILNVTQLSKLLGVSTKLAKELLRENKIKHKKVGREYRVAKIHVIEYMNIVPEGVLMKS